jgi:thiol-disulfide isomerase/thioredoxin
MTTVVRWIALAIVVGSSAASHADGPAPSSVTEIQATHDRALIKDLVAYLGKTPRPEDLDQAYLTLFNKVIEHDWFLDHEAVAKDYLRAYPEGPVRPLAQIIATMARAQGGTFAEALVNFKALMAGLNGSDQLDFAANFADSLAGSATAAGEVGIAREVYTQLLRKFGGDSPSLKQKVADDLARLDRVGRPVPSFEVKDVDGKSFRFEDLKGKYVLVDFWATWCAPCLAELPRIQAAEARYRGKGFAVVSISIDETKGALVDFVRLRKYPWTQIHNATCTADLVQGFGVNTIPATFLIDPRGVIVRLDLRGAALDKALESLLDQGQRTAQPR